jgi:hypothetical protein
LACIRSLREASYEQAVVGNLADHSGRVGVDDDLSERIIESERLVDIHRDILQEP